MVDADVVADVTLVDEGMTDAVGERYAELVVTIARQVADVTLADESGIEASVGIERIMHLDERPVLGVTAVLLESGYLDVCKMSHKLVLG